MRARLPRRPLMVVTVVALAVAALAPAAAATSDGAATGRAVLVGPGSTTAGARR